MTFIILQLIPKASNASTLLMIGMFVVVVLFIIFGTRSGSSGASSSEKGAGYGRFRFSKLARLHDLSPHHIRTLRRTIRNQRVANPENLFIKEKFLNQTLKKRIANVKSSDMSDKAKTQSIAEIFEIKHRIATHASKALSRRSGETHNLTLGQAVTMYSKTLPPTHTKVTGNLKQYLVVESPRNMSNSPMKYRIGEPLKMRFITDSSNAYAFMTKVKEFQIINGVENILVNHSKSVEHNQLRKEKRREINKAVHFQLVEIIHEGGKKRVLAQKNSTLGQLEDISQGGCGVYSRKPLLPKKMIKLFFNVGTDKDITLYGKVCNVAQRKTASGVGGLMHISFTQVSAKDLNEIQSYVYGFLDA